MLFSIICTVGLLSLISRALTHKYQVWKCCDFILLSFLGYFFWTENLIGLRWLLPRIFWIKEIYNLIFVAWIAAVIWNLMKIMLVHLNVTWRKVFVSLFAVLFIAYNIISLLPFRREYNYYHINTPPPRPASLESSPLSIEKFLSQIPDTQSGEN